MEKQQYIKPQASVIIIQNTLLTDASNKYSGGDSATLNRSTMEDGDGGDAASRDGGWDEW